MYGQQPLFLEPEMIKGARAPKLLSPNPATWQSEIMEELLTEHPYLNDYNIELKVEQVQPENGALYGTVIINPRSPTTNMPVDDFFGIPIIAEGRKLKPFDVMGVQGDFQPLNEDRVGKIFPREDLGSSAVPPADNVNPSIYSQVMSPMQTMQGYGIGGQTMKTASLIESLSGTVTEDAIQAFIKAAGKEEFLVAADKNPAVRPVLERIDKLALADDENLDDVARRNIEPTVMQVRPNADGSYTVKSASSAVYDPIVRKITPAEFSDLPQNIRELVLKDGYATYVDTDNELPATSIPNLDKLAGFCKCSAFIYGEKPQEGVLIPAVRMDGTPCGSLFMGGEFYAMQDAFAGVKQEDFSHKNMEDIRGSKPGGHGVFLYKKAGAMVATEPLTVSHTVTNGTVQTHTCSTDSGRPCSVRQIAGFIGVAKDGDNTYILPQDTAFMSLATKEARFEKSAELIQKAVKSQADFVKVSSNGTRWTIEGDAVDGIPVKERHEVGKAQAAFVLGATGISQEVSGPILKRAAAGRTQEVQVRYEVQDKAVFEKYAEDVAQQFQEVFSKMRLPGHSLVKAAAQAVEDVQTLDALLSLGFLSPQNIEVFINYIPELEAALHHVSELLVTARLGLGLNEQALKNCMDSLEEIIQDLEFIANDGQSQFQATTATQPNSATPYDVQAAPGAPAQVQANPGMPATPTAGAVPAGPAGPSTGGQPMQGGLG
jgi:hypothetical protein